MLIFTGILLLYAGAELLVKWSVRVSTFYKLPMFLTGMMIIGLGTSSPELFVTIEASLSGLGELAVGNIIGSNIS
ncbi:hypothetical protein QLX67_09010, partial [Balneolaceae bacterium ANBcel3]|nr:hypothetical protein [Balneolaceae bacterium ANBcel3]